MEWHKYYLEQPQKTGIYYVKQLTQNLEKTEAGVSIPRGELYDDLLIYVVEKDIHDEEFNSYINKAGFYLQIGGCYYKIHDKDIAYWSEIPEMKLTQEDAEEIYKRYYE